MQSIMGKYFHQQKSDRRMHSIKAVMNFVKLDTLLLKQYITFMVWQNIFTDYTILN